MTTTFIATFLVLTDLRTHPRNFALVHVYNVNKDRVNVISVSSDYRAEQTSDISSLTSSQQQPATCKILPRLNDLNPSHFVTFADIIHSTMGYAYKLLPSHCRVNV